MSKFFLLVVTIVGIQILRAETLSQPSANGDQCLDLKSKPVEEFRDLLKQARDRAAEIRRLQADTAMDETQKRAALAKLGEDYAALAAKIEKHLFTRSLKAFPKNKKSEAERRAEKARERRKSEAPPAPPEVPAPSPAGTAETPPCLNTRSEALKEFALIIEDVLKKAAEIRNLQADQTVGSKEKTDRLAALTAEGNLLSKKLENSDGYKIIVGEILRGTMGPPKKKERPNRDESRFGGNPAGVHGGPPSSPDSYNKNPEPAGTTTGTADFIN